MYKIENQDILEWAKNYKGEKFHTLFCDPPYSLNFMGKGWDNDIAFKPNTWRTLSEHLYDGAFCMAFASARGFHRMAVAIEDAGFIIHPTIFNWVNSQGFPKATRIDSQIQPIEEQTILSRNPNSRENCDKSNTLYESGTVGKTAYITEPSDPMAKRWTGHRYGGQILKPCVEPILVFQKPYKGKPINNIVETGSGALNVDGGRIKTNDETRREKSGWQNNGYVGGKYDSKKYNAFESRDNNGRWPSNFILTHHPECEYSDKEEIENWNCHPDCPIKRLNAQAGIRKSGARKSNYKVGKTGVNGNLSNYGIYGDRKAISFDDAPADEGNVNRFFFNADYILEKIEESDSVIYSPKASRKERDAGLNNFDDVEAGMRSETSGQHITRRDGGDHKKCKNNHPTVKPISLCKYLATLLFPPKEYAPRRILVPFAGSGSEMIASVLAGWEEVIGIEQDPEYCKIAEARLKYWTKKQEQGKLF